MKIVNENSIVPPEWMGGDTEATVEQWGQQEYETGRKDGAKDGMAQAVLIVTNAAMEAFRDGHDEKASVMRDIAKELLKRLEATKP